MICMGYDTDRLYDDTIVPPLSSYFHLTSFARVPPAFFIIGVQKGGTTTLTYYLRQHPETIPSQRKDIYFFNNTLRYEKGLNWYKAYFPLLIYKQLYDLKNHVNSITFDGTPDYFDVPEAPERMFKHFPHAKLILLLRNPIDRAYSCYQMARKFGFETLSFEEALEIEEDRLEKQEECAPFHPHHNFVYERLTYKKRGVYINYIKKWKELFGDNLLVLKSEDLRQDTQTQLDIILKFLSLTPFDKFDLSEKNLGIYEKSMKDETRHMLAQYYKPYNEELYAYLNMDFGW